MRFSLPPDEKTRLEAIVADETGYAKRCIVRAKMLLMCAEQRYLAGYIASVCGCHAATISGTLKRYREQGLDAAIAFNYKKSPPTICKPDVNQRILDLHNEFPAAHLQRLADMAIERGIVPTISSVSVGRILRSHGITSKKCERRKLHDLRAMRVFRVVLTAEERAIVNNIINTPGHWTKGRVKRARVLLILADETLAVDAEPGHKPKTNIKIAEECGCVRKSVGLIYHDYLEGGVKKALGIEKQQPAPEIPEISEYQQRISA